MNETRLLRRVIHYIWECYQDRGEMKIRLEGHSGDQLHVEEESTPLKIVVRYFAAQPGGELVKEVEIICFIIHSGEWVPLEVYKEDSLSVYGMFNADSGQVHIDDHKGQWEAAGFCDAWALRLLEEGFLASAAKLKPLGTKPERRPTWPQPTTSVPTLEQIEEWMWEDGGCEASDGCWVEIDVAP